MPKIEECFDCDKMKVIHDSARCYDCYETWIETKDEAADAVAAGFLF